MLAQPCPAPNVQLLLLPPRLLGRRSVTHFTDEDTEAQGTQSLRHKLSPWDNTVNSGASLPSPDVGQGWPYPFSASMEDDKAPVCVRGRQWREYCVRGSAGATMGVARHLPAHGRGGPGPGPTQASRTSQLEGPWDAHPSSQPPHSPGPQTVDLTPVFSSTGTRLTAPSMCGLNTSQSRSKRPKANLSDTWGGRWGHSPVTATPRELSPASPARVSGGTGLGRAPQASSTDPSVGPVRSPSPCWPRPTCSALGCCGGLYLVTQPPRLLPPILLSQTTPSLALKPPRLPVTLCVPQSPPRLGPVHVYH